MNVTDCSGPEEALHIATLLIAGIVTAVVVALVVDARFNVAPGSSGPTTKRATAFAIDDETLIPPDTDDGDASGSENVEVVHEFVRGAADDDRCNSD